nr:MAG TPA: hypothetical protein [Caudoviricetes sp.]
MFLTIHISILILKSVSDSIKFLNLCSNFQFVNK